jgi:acyl-CoA hydrolase
MRPVSRRARPLVAYADGPDIATSPPSHFGGEPCDVFLGWMPATRSWLDGPLSGWTHMAGYALRDAIDDGRVRYVPTRLSGVPAVLAALQPDVVVVSGVRRGHELAYAGSVGWAPAAIAAGAQLTVEIDDDAVDVGAPLVEGPVHRTVPVLRPPPEPTAAAAPSTADRHVAELVVDLLPRDATLQFGIGALADAIVRTVDRPVQVWSGFVSDAVAVLAERGLLRGQAVGAYLLPGAPAADLVRSGAARLVPITESHGAAHLAEQSRLVAVNTALQVGLDGSVNVERIGGRLVAGIGGHADFSGAAARAADGLSVVAVRATHKGASTIVPVVETVSTSRCDVDVVVTEHGAADLRACDDGERADRLVAVAAPEHRATLAAAAPHAPR